MVRKDEYIECSCYGEGIRFSFDGTDGCTLYVSLWKSRAWQGTSWRQRLRHIWKIIRTGEPWDDEIVLDREGIDKLYDYMNRLAGPATNSALVGYASAVVEPLRVMSCTSASYEGPVTVAPPTKEQTNAFLQVVKTFQPGAPDPRPTDDPET